MYSNFIKVGIRNIFKNKGYSFINITGLASGLAVAILIGLWIWDECSHDQYHKNYDRIAFVMQHNMYNGEMGTQYANPYLLSEEIRNNFGSDFKYVLQSSWTMSHILSAGEKNFNKSGNYFENGVIDMLSLKMLKGNDNSLKDPYSIIVSESLAKAFFGDEDPMNKTIRLNNKTDVKVTGVYEDLPQNSSFNEMAFVLPWELYLITQDWIRKMEDPWGSNFTQTFAMLNANADFEKVSAKIKDVKLNKVREDDKRYKPQVFLHPMSKWHLYSDFKNGINTGGRIEFVWLFGIIGAFVLLLSCINFMNLSTARSEKRAKEVGVRKAIGSIRGQLIGQFFSESFLVVAFAFIISLGIVQIMLPFFNEVAGKKMNILWSEPVFWIFGIGFSLITGLVAGSYPAFYLSSFEAARVLKGTFRAGRFASIPRKALVIVQFTVSITLIIGTIIVFQQIQFAKNRPMGYDRNGLIQMFMATGDIHDHFDAVRNELKNSGAIVEMTESTSPTTSDWNTNGGFDWTGKDPAQAVDFPNNGVTAEYGKTVGWEFLQGRDFSRDFASDSSAFVLNEAAAQFIGFKDKAVGEIIKWDGKPFKVIGVIKNMIVQSPYEPVRPSLFHISRNRENNMIIRLNPTLSAHEALQKIEVVFKKFAPANPFEYTFVDEDYGKKFGDEERVGKLATFFAVLAIFISCLGIFGLASFTAEQRTKEIGIRKVLGASVLNLWQMLSRDFVILVVISCVIAIPISWYALSQWLLKYQYRTEIGWWIFAAAAIGALIITLLTVSYQSIKAAVANPVNSLKSE
jgi:putative ABC transport system permease protein